MNNLADLLILLVLIAIIGTWLKLSTARERAIQEARRQCQLHDLQLLDETVGLRAIRWRRHNGLRLLERCYGFEVSVDGDDRKPGHLWMTANSLISVSLPRSHAEQGGEPPLSTTSSNVISLTSRQRSSERLH